MRTRCLLVALILQIPFLLFAQSRTVRPGEAFWKEDFSSGKIPDKWMVKALNDSSIVWEITDQPFPGSFGYDQQAPPIASSSRGYHLQCAPGVKVDRFYRRWEKAGISPDTYIQTAPIDCRGKHLVDLKFQQNLKWNDWAKVRPGGGLMVGVSNNGKDWKEFDARFDITSEADCPNPMNVELNISAIAAMQDSVCLRFFWRGIYAWYWMVDDIELCEALESDLSASSLVSHPVKNNVFTSNEVFRFNVVNLSAKEICKPFDCYLKIDNRQPVKTTVPFSNHNPFGIVDTVSVAFPAADLTDYGIHSVLFYTDLEGDSRRENDTLELQLFSRAYELGPVTGIEQRGHQVEISCHNARIFVDFCREDIFRIQMAYNGQFADPAGKDIVISKPDNNPVVHLKDAGNYYLISTEQAALRVYKDSLRFELYKSDNSSLIWAENKGLTYGEETIQYLKRARDEYFYGGGMQNGRFSHRDKTIKLAIDWNWEEGGNPNPAPFYMSTMGYGALRNTYAPGEYSFKDTVRLSHKESRFDCYYFTGESLKDLLNDYTDLTGKPFLPPRWALGMGDANCYNRGANKSRNTTGYKGTTPDVIPLIADKYIEHDMPRGWILPNDGYGCGYTRLDSVVTELAKRGFHTGLWTENGVEKIAREVGEYGSRLCKLDVAWVGNGYKFAIDGCKAAYDGIENNSDARGFVWSVCGWAGTHRNSVVWTGDQSGSWDYIRWHIPTVTGSGLSAQNCATGDIDGIFGGSPKTFTRDLQWKCFTPVLMSMSGWAPQDKQPFVHGEPYTSINRSYLKLRMRLTPYMYSLCHEAAVTGVPAVRAMVLEYPEDMVCRGDEVNYQFMLGKSLLVAPVFRDEEVRDSIYLPAGDWFDYWDGRKYEGGKLLSKYPAPLSKLPVFVKAGSVIPMYPQMNFDGERPADTLTLDIYPGNDASFELYEDDGSTREYRDGAFSLTRISFQNTGTGDQEIVVGAADGEFKGRLKERAYIVKLHGNEIPDKVYIQNKKIQRYRSMDLFRKGGEGWCLMTDGQPILYIRTNFYPTGSEITISVKR